VDFQRNLVCVPKTARRHDPADDNHRTPSHWRTDGGFGVFNPSEIPKSVQNIAKLNPIVLRVKSVEFRTPTPHYVRKKGSKILKLRNFTIILH